MVIPASAEPIPPPTDRSDGYSFGSGWICLDFINTAGGHNPPREEGLRTYPHLVAWGRQAGIIDTETVHGLRRNAEERAEEADTALAGAIDLRETLFRIFVSAAAGREPEPGDLAAFNARLGPALAHGGLRPVDGEFRWQWETPDNQFECMLWPVIGSAARLLASPADLKRVRNCVSETCDWMFLDTSKNASRRWCSMRGCGNRAKARRHYERQRASN